MHSLLSKRGAAFAGLLALVLAALVPTVAHAGPEPAAKGRGFRLFARSLGALTVNRIYCGLASAGQICVDSTNSSTIGGGYWPKGTPNQYIFNSGLQIAGVIGDDGGPWANDTTGAFFFDPKGTTEHGEEVRPIYNSTNPDDLVNWPEAAYVRGDLFDPLLQGRPIASQGDIWFMSWDGNPALGAGRPHPLGVLVETRGMGWNYPAGNEDILYFIYRFYNITSLNAADYAQHDPATQAILLEKAQDFHDLNNQAFGITLPTEGYTITDMYAAFASDNDVADAGANYSSVNLPFALGYSYERTFGQPAGWLFPADIFGAPFFPGAGFIGMKYLKSPTGPGEIQLYSNTLNSSTGFRDPQNTDQLFRYLSGNVSVAAGDQPCNVTGTDQVCFISPTFADTRFFQSSTALTLAPGEEGSIVIAYIMAAPVQVASFTSTGTTNVSPGDVTATNDPALLNTNGAVPMVDSLTGFLGWDDENSDGIPQQAEFQVVPGSLLGKSLTAQAVFDGGFLLPFAPEAPEFFLIPGDNQVTVVWRPSASEATGDPFFAVASQPTVFDEELQADVVNPLFDPNYRQFDVEGYRIYRGRVDAPGELALIAQFDYNGTAITDFYGRVNPIPGCAPEFGIGLGVGEDCGDVEAPVAGVAPTVEGESYPLVGEIVQIQSGGRVELADGTALVVAADTTVTGQTGTCGPRQSCPELEDSGVPFVYTDNNVRNNFRYFYAVTAFDVNSFQSGPTNLESPRSTKVVTPRPTASNVASNLEYGDKMAFGRGEALNLDAPIPTIDASTGTFSGPFPAARAWDLQFVSAVSEVLDGTGAIRARLDSISAGNYWHDEPHVFWFTGINAAGEETGTASAPIVQDFVERTFETHSTAFLAAPLGAGAEQFGGSDDFSLTAQVDLQLPGGYFTIGWGRGWAFGPQAPGFETVEISQYNGPRWFTGETEPANPVANNAITPTTFAEWSNAGALPNVSVIHAPRAYLQGYAGVATRDYEGVLGPYARGADFNVYWGEGGVIDSVIDMTHNVVVEFDPRGQTGYGLLTAASATGAGSDDEALGVVTFADFNCIEMMLLHVQGAWACGAVPSAYQLVNTATLSPVAIANSPGGLATAAAAVPAGQQGFGLYMPGHFFIMETDQIPADGTVWTLRSYIGAFGGGGADPYVFYEAPLPLTAAGVEIQVDYEATNALNAVTASDLDEVHTVPDPYYVTNAFEQTTDNKIIQFVNLPQRAIIRIYSVSGVLVDVIEHNSSTAGGAASWNLRNRNNQVVASGVYFFHIESGDARKIGKFTVVNFAQ